MSTMWQDSEASLEVFGLLDVFNTLGARLNLQFPSIIVTHTLDPPPSDLEVLVVPGRGGTRSPDPQPEVEFIRDTFPSLRYVIGVSTGNALLARARIPNGKKATGNKKSWTWLTSQSKKVHWIGKARWVVSSERIWSTSGIGAGVDGTLDWVSKIYGEAIATEIENGKEWSRVTGPNLDEFADIWGAKDVLPTELAPYDQEVASPKSSRHSSSFSLSVDTSTYVLTPHAPLKPLASHLVVNTAAFLSHQLQAVKSNIPPQYAIQPPINPPHQQLQPHPPPHHTIDSTRLRVFFF
ncbi:class I glutamine amidotransferase-like protein [Coprinopsis sp. MPI-PUGE-AT-0042]|nr:class I glutamine amidotransferase-like protein [Coprinopsis sp. MPI-PUGE-AT-0042]